MTLIHTAPAVTPFPRGNSTGGRRWHVDPAIAVAVAVFLIALVADGLLIATAAPNLPDLSSLYVSSI